MDDQSGIMIHQTKGAVRGGEWLVGRGVENGWLEEGVEWLVGRGVENGWLEEGWRMVGWKRGGEWLVGRGVENGVVSGGEWLVGRGDGIDKLVNCNAYSTV